MYLACTNFSFFFLMITYDFTDKLKEIERPTNFNGYLNLHLDTLTTNSQIKYSLIIVALWVVCICT